MLVGGWDNSPPKRIGPPNLGKLGINFDGMELERLLWLSLADSLWLKKLIYRWWASIARWQWAGVICMDRVPTSCICQCFKYINKLYYLLNK